GDEGFTGGELGRRSRGCAGGHGKALDAEAPGSLGDGNVRPAVGPATAECEIEAQAELAGFFAGETEGLDETIGEIGQVADALLGIVKLEGIDGLDFDAADAAFLHGAQLAFEFVVGDGGAEPPPADHDARVGGRLFEGAAEIGDGGGRRGRQEETAGHERSDDTTPQEFCAHTIYATGAAGAPQGDSGGRRGAAGFRNMKRAIWLIIVLTGLPDTLHSEKLSRKL